MRISKLTQAELSELSDKIRIGVEFVEPNDFVTNFLEALGVMDQFRADRKKGYLDCQMLKKESKKQRK